MNTATRETLYRAEALSSRLAGLTITDILYVCMAVRLRERMLENLPLVQTAIARRRW